MTIEDYHDLKNADAKQIKELFHSADHLVASPLVQVIYMIIMIAWVLGALIMVPLLFMDYLTNTFSISQSNWTLLFVVYILIFFGIPYWYLLSKGMGRITKPVVLLHLIELGENYYIGKIPLKFQKKANRLIEIAEKTPRTDLKLTAELMGEDIEPYKWDLAPKPLAKVPKTIVELDGEEVVFYRNKLRRNIGYFAVYSIVLLFVLISINYAIKPEEFIFRLTTCCIPLVIIVIIMGVTVPYFIPKRIGFSSRGVFIEKQPGISSVGRSKVILFVDINDISLQRKGGNKPSNFIIKKDGERIGITLLDNALQEEMYLRFQKFKEQGPESESVILDKKYYWVTNKQYLRGTQILFAIFFAAIIIPAILIIMLESLYLFLYGTFYIDDNIMVLIILLIIDSVITLLMYKREKRILFAHQMTLPLKKRPYMEKLIENLFTGMELQFEKREKESKIKRFEVSYSLQSLNFDFILQGHWLDDNLYCIIYTKSNTDENIIKKIKEEVVTELIREEAS
jgi:hypothetical protein